MKRTLIVFLTLSVICLFCACSQSDASEQGDIGTAESPKLEQSPAAQEQPSAGQSIEETIDEMFGYRYAIPSKNGSVSKASGALADTDFRDLYIYGLDYLEYFSWEEAVDQCKNELFNTVFSATNFLAADQTATADAPFTNAHGVEMMRVTGELSGSAGTKPYIAYYYVTDENYLRFMICLNYENEADAAEVIDYVAERLEKA